VKENAENVVVASKKIGLEVNVDRTKYMVMYRDHNAARICSMKNDNRSFERVEEFKYLGTILTKENYIQEDFKSNLKLGNACYHPVQNHSYSRLLSKNFNYNNTVITNYNFACCFVWV